MPLLVGSFLAALTFPLWAGALAAVVGFGFHLMVTAPWIFGGIVLLLLLANFL
jgi:hypothetical protein